MQNRSKMMIRKFTLSVALTALFSFALFAQEEVWSLERCIRYAQENTLQMKQAQFNIELAELSKKQANLARLPSLNGSLSGGWQFGRTINPTTNLFENETSFAGRIGIDAGLVLYDGSRINNTVKQTRLDLEAAQLEAQASANDLGLLVAQAYLSILLAEENLENAEKRVELSRRQLELTDKQIQAGTLPENDRLNFVAQIAIDEQAVIDGQNQVALNLLSLKNLLQIDPSVPFDIERPDFDIPEGADPNIYSLNEVYNTALNTQPQIRAGEARLGSARLQENIAKAGIAPRVILFGNINTNYSSLFQDFNNPNLDDAMLVLNTPQPVKINGEDALLADYSLQGIVFPDVAFWDQINRNFGQSLGVSVSVPIYNNHTNRLNIERARLQALNQEVTNLQARQQLKTDVQRAIADARAAYRSMEAATRSLEAADAAFQNTEKRFNLGAINALEYTTARNNLDRAENDLTLAKYQFLFNLKVVDFYLGMPIKLD